MIRVDYAQDNKDTSNSRGGGQSARDGNIVAGGRGESLNPWGGFSGGGGFVQQGQQRQYSQGGSFGGQQRGTNFGP